MIQGRRLTLVMPHDVVDQVLGGKRQNEAGHPADDHQQQAKRQHPAARSHQRPDFRQDFAQLRFLFTLRRIRRHASGGRL